MPGHLGAGGCDQARLLSVPGGLRQLQAVAAEIDADRVCRCAEPASKGIANEVEHKFSAPWRASIDLAANFDEVRFIRRRGNHDAPCLGVRCIDPIYRGVNQGARKTLAMLLLAGVYIGRADKIR